jgi:hypothetical protein
MTEPAGGGRLTEAQFRELYEKLRAVPPWGPQDRRGALNYLTLDVVAAACRDVRLGRSVSMDREPGRGRQPAARVP